MSLNRNGIDKIRACRRIQCPDDLTGENLVLAPARWISFYVIHIFNGGKGIKAKLGKHPVPVIKSCLVVMDRMGTVT